jgi:hypothetical protein
MEYEFSVDIIKILAALVQNLFTYFRYVIFFMDEGIVIGLNFFNQTHCGDFIFPVIPINVLIIYL